LQVWMHVGLIGVGRIGAFHARQLGDDELVDRLTLTDADSGRAIRVSAELGAAVADNPDALLACDIDALVIAAATPAHAELLHRAVEASIPTFCEKPIALDLAATDAVIEHVKRSRTFVQIGFQRRFDPGYRSARDAVTSGAIGDVHLVRMATHDPAPPPEAYVAESGGIWRDLAIHDFDIAGWVVGRPIVEVYADGAAHDPLFARHQDVDAACALLRFDGGAIGVATAARNDPRGYDVRLEVFGLRDSVTVGCDARTPLRSLEPGVPAPAQRGYVDFLDRFQGAYRAELHTFLAAVKDGAESPCTVEEARQALAVALAADRSRRERRPVRLEEVG
ncbi:MAG: Gfo/Idh/MocA family protein, partial [Candidatus Dormibacteraceae bacterium]